MDNVNKKDPFEIFKRWYAEAKESEPALPDAMTLATADINGFPSARTVLLKSASENGFLFYTNLESQKGLELSENPKAALLFHWKSLKRQVRISGIVEPVGEDEADAYFASRPRGAQIGAWASDQSRPMNNQFELEKNVAKFTAKFGISKISRPKHWSGWCLAPLSIEFWVGGKYRIHERLRYNKLLNNWKKEILYP